MRILIVFPGALYPITGMSQVRAVNQLKRLARDHEIALTDIVVRPRQEEECLNQLGNLIAWYKPIHAAAFHKSRLFRAVRYVFLRVRHLVSSLSMEELTLSDATVRKQIAAIIRESAPDAILIHYWYMGYAFDYLIPETLKMIDTHYLVEENLDLLPRYRMSAFYGRRMLRELRHCFKLQHSYFEKTDLIIVNSSRQRAILKNSHPDYNVTLTVNGQSLDELLSFQIEVDENAILFYGALSNQFNRLALERVLARIFPVLLKENPALHLYIVGSNPPGDIIKRFHHPNITVTGFVQDIRPVIGSCSLLILPLETGSGFRGRAVEVMALGVPIIGTSNALQSVGIKDGKQGFLAETDEEILEKTCKILKDKELRNRMSAACRKFAKDNFSIEATFGKLSQEITEAKKEKIIDE